jgi:phenylacetate-CoA ligase
MNRSVAKSLFYLMEFIRGENVYRYLRELERNQYLSKEEMVDLQKKKLNKLLNFVLSNNPYYSRKYKGYDVIDGFQMLPPLKKEELRENYQNILSTSSKKHLDLVETSGSTGIPLQFYRDRMVFGYNLASLYRARRWWGLDIGYKEAMLWGVPINAKARFKAKIRDMFLNRFREREYNINPDTLLDFYHKILKMRVDYIFGYSSMVYEFALYVRERKLDGKALGLKAAICTAENIHDYQRDTIYDVLGCKVINEYGATETGQC